MSTAKKQASQETAMSTVKTSKASKGKKKVEAAVSQAPKEERAERRKVIAVKESFGRYYVYFRGVAPEQNVGCGCKSKQSAMRYCHLLMARYNAFLPEAVISMLKSETAKEA